MRKKELKILDAVNILKKEKINNRELTAKRDLPLFMFNFECKEDVDRIYKIKTILNINIG